MNLLTINDRPGEYPGSFYAQNIAPLTDCEPLDGDVSCDVCIVGGGFTGLSAALHLAQRGYDVRLLEAQRPGFGASGRNGGQVGQGQRLDQDELESMLGKSRAKALWEIGTQSVELIRDLAERDEIDATYHPGIAYVDHRKRNLDHSKAYVEKMNRDYDYAHISYLDQEQVRQLIKSPAYFGGTLDMRSGHIDPLQLALGIGRLALKAGAKLHERSLVTAVKQGPAPQVVTDRGTVSAKFVVLACNGYIGSLQKPVSRRVMPLNNYIVATEPLSAEAQAEVMSQNIAVADSKFVVNYFRFSDDRRMLFGGTESYGYRFPADIASKVRKPMSAIFPQLSDARIDYAWGGTLGITMNRMPHFACYDGTVFSMSGFSGHGVAMGTLSGQIVAEAIAGQAERFDIMTNVPTPRFPGGPMMRQPLMILAMLWYSMRDKL